MIRDTPTVRTSRVLLVWEVFIAFLRLGLTSFGGPTAHLGYFRTEFVLKRRWLSEQVFAELVAVTQFLPGPASSQCGFGIGLLRARWSGAIAAFCGFTLPSAVLMVLFAYAEPAMAGPFGGAVLHGLKLVAVAVVANALVGMSRQLTPDLRRVLIAAFCAAAALLVARWWIQVAVIAIGGACGWLWCRDVATASGESFAPGFGTHAAAILGTTFVVLLVLSLALPADTVTGLRLAAGLFQSGALVFGGGHVVLPLLQDTLVDTGLIGADDFLTGYGAAQAVPGPMFSLAAYFGARIGGLPMALLAVVAIFLPGFLLLGAVLPVWSSLIARPAARYTLAGLNAAVVGVLLAAFYDPVCTAAVESVADIVIAATGFALLFRWQVSAIWIVLVCVSLSIGRMLLPA